MRLGWNVRVIRSFFARDIIWGNLCILTSKSMYTGCEGMLNVLSQKIFKNGTVQELSENWYMKMERVPVTGSDRCHI